MCRLFAPALGATSSSATVSGTTKIINGNTYIYPNGKVGTSANDTIIIKPYTDEQIQEAEEALEPVFASFYLSNDKTLCEAIATDDFNHICEYRNWTPDFSSLYSDFSFSINMPPFSEEKTVAEAIINPTSVNYIIMMKDNQRINVGLQHIVIRDGAYHVMGYQDFESAYITYDLRTHSVDVYAMLKDSDLDLTKTAATLFMCEAGQYYLFSDGVLEFVTPIGYQPEFSPYEVGEGYPDASSSFQLISGPDFIKAMIQTSQQITASRSSSNNSEPVVIETDSTVSEPVSEQQINSPNLSVDVSFEISVPQDIPAQNRVDFSLVSQTTTEVTESAQTSSNAILVWSIPVIAILALALILVISIRRKKHTN